MVVCNFMFLCVEISVTYTLRVSVYVESIVVLVGCIVVLSFDNFTLLTLRNFFYTLL